jgi:hypothetical protein
MIMKKDNLLADLKKEHCLPVGVVKYLDCLDVVETLASQHA